MITEVITRIEGAGATAIPTIIQQVITLAIERAEASG
jgi:hypothetical protein